MKKILLVGSVGCGKTTLLQRLQDSSLDYQKTETIQSIGYVTDTPGEYLEVPFYKHALRMASFDVDLVVMLASSTVAEAKFPPGFTTFFTPPSIGVVTKTDVASDQEIQNAKNHLTLAGAQKIFAVSSYTGDGIDELKEFLE